MHFDVAIRQVPGPTGCSDGARRLAGKRAIAHALHVA